MKKIIFFLFFSGSFANAQIVNIPDANFKALLLSASPSNGIAFDANYYNCSIDLNNDGEIQLNEIQNIYRLAISGLDISNLSGIEYFTNLSILSIYQTNVTNLNLNMLVNLIQLYCNNNYNLNTINIDGLVNLKHLDCRDNNISGDINFNQLTSIETISFDNNLLSNIELFGLLNLEQVYVGHNLITNLTIDNCPQLFQLWCNNNFINELELNHLTELTSLECGGNLLTSIDVSQLHHLNTFYFSDNNYLTKVFMKNGSYHFTDNLVGLNSLNYICADENEISYFQQLLASNGYTNFTINSYCSFVPGGEYYIVEGNAVLGDIINGCNNAVNFYSNLKLSVTDGNNVGDFITNQYSHFQIPLGAGTHTLTPQIENSNYFQISPTNCTVIFPSQSSPFTQNFCITPNGIHHDVEVVIVPTIPARPGFDAHYNIIFKNKGNQIENGVITFNFDDSIVDFVYAYPIFSVQDSNLLTWQYFNLQPFESRIVELVLNINSPMEMPSVNIDDFLGYSADITPILIDENTSDNHHRLKQKVVGSFDPNDKTCLEGETINNSMIGQYVHYMIRFENTGTYPAQNIVVKDMIDTTKFDVATLQITKTSHNCYTKITGNKVEFIFENINLPFDDATNDGYVVFKIITLPTLTTNSVIENTADIFFDYNFPITTNTASSIFSNLETAGFDATKVSVSPNPTRNSVLVKSVSKINSIAIFDIQGRQLQTKLVHGFETSIDVSHLQLGNYLLKISTENGVINHKIIKQ